MDGTPTFYFSIFFCCLVSRVGSANVAVKKGEDATLACGYTADTRVWKKGSTEIADKDLSGHAKYELTGNEFDLKIKATEDADVELYTCEESSGGSTTTLVRLLIIDAYSCTLANEDSDKVKLSCAATTDGHGTAGFAFDVNGGGYDTAMNSGTQAAMGRDIIRTAADAEVLSCKIEYSAVPVGASTPNPTFVPTGYDVCSKTTAKPADVAVTSSGSEETLAKDDVLTCTATGLPTPTLKWTDEQDGDLVAGASYTVTEELAGGSVKCVATNNIEEVSILFPASTEETTTSDPVTDTPIAPVTAGCTRIKFSFAMTSLLLLCCTAM